MSVAPASIVTWNVLPRPGTPALSTRIVPSIISARRLLIARPRPVPPYRRLVVASTWLNDWNRRSTRPGGIPIPVSRTVRWYRTVSGRSAGSEAAVTTTSPASVNFTALFSRLSKTWRIRLASPTAVSGVPGSISYATSRPFFVAIGPIRSTTDSMQARRSNGARSSSIRPASIFEKSRMSLMIERSASPLFAIVPA